tara:strand:+ start:483 stop:917 length:435 start_codon:yes stop_codon:yes gene_type:complete
MTNKIIQNKKIEKSNGKEPETLAERVIYKRKMMGMRAVDLAKRLDISPTSLNHLEMGNVKQPQYMADLAEKLDTTIDWLLNGQEEPNVVRVSEHITLIAVDTPIQPDSKFDYYVVKIDKNKKPFYADNMVQIGKVNKIFIGHKN